MAALLDLGGVLHAAAHADLQHAGAGGHLILQRRPVKADGALSAQRDALVDPAGGVLQTQGGVVALAAATAAGAAGGCHLDAIANALPVGRQPQQVGLGIKLQIVTLGSDLTADLVRVHALGIPRSILSVLLRTLLHSVLRPTTLLLSSARCELLVASALGICLRLFGVVLRAGAGNHGAPH